MRIEESQKCAKGVHLADLAKYLEFPRRGGKKGNKVAH
ncbi:pyocin activator PrtN family protein [Mesorhizobium sp.]|nr:pyocin activator PrtN family protein [Mesorhizobium sp.]